MSLDKFYKNLWIENSHDEKQIAEALHKIGFLRTATLMSSSKNEPDQMAFCEKLFQLWKKWLAKGIVSKPLTLGDILSNVDRIKDKILGSIVNLKYLDHLKGARFWKNRWAKDARGTSLFVNPETGEVSVLSYRMPRGAEVLTGVTKAVGAESQDTSKDEESILDAEQTNVTERLASGQDQEISGHLSFKADGSLLVINVWTGWAKDVMDPVIELFGNEYVRLWQAQSRLLSKGLALVMPATNGTVFEGGFMAPYMVSSILASSGILRDTLAGFPSYLDAWEKFGKDFIKKVLSLKTFGLAQSFLFEAICSQRQGLFGDSEHTELAVSYDVDRLVFLGTGLDKCIFIPASVFTGLSSKAFNLRTFPFEQPLFWKICKSSQVNGILKLLEELTIGKITKKDFLMHSPPSNPEFDPENEKMVDKAIIDYEGFVLMKDAVYASFPDLEENCTAIRIPLMIYSKIKSVPYYLAHKFRASNLEYLRKLASATSVFPLANKVVESGLFDVNTLHARFEAVFNGMRKMLDVTESQENLINMMKGFAKKDGKTKLFEGFDTRSPETQCKILLNSTIIPEGVAKMFLRPLFQSHFPEMGASEEVLPFLMPLTMKHLKPWLENSNHIASLDYQGSGRDPTIKEFLAKIVSISL